MSRSLGYLQCKYYIYIYMYREYIYVHFFHTDVKRNAAMASFAREGKGKVSEGLFGSSEAEIPKPYLKASG